jgi:membrane-associated phospholipid phosphatase
MRAIVNAGESISFAMPHAAEIVQRDAFPSGHTELSLLVVYLSHHYKLKTRWIITALATLLIFSTVYLRYHYVVDVIAGFVCFFFVVWSGNRFQRWWLRITTA